MFTIYKYILSFGYDRDMISVARHMYWSELLFKVWIMMSVN